VTAEAEGQAVEAVAQGEVEERAEARAGVAEQAEAADPAEEAVAAGPAEVAVEEAVAVAVAAVAEVAIQP
jgi:hypothetical protein